MEPANQAQGQTLKVYGLCVCGRGDSKPCQNAGIDTLQLGKLFSQVADVLHESGCWCLTERFKGMSLALEDLGKGGLGFDVGQQNTQNNNGTGMLPFSAVFSPFHRSLL